MRGRALVLLLLVPLLGVTGAGADGLLDPTFGNGGLVTTTFPPPPLPPFVTFEAVRSLVILPDGRTVAAGATSFDVEFAEMAVARYLTSGALDTTFSGDGLVKVDFLQECGFGSSVAAGAETVLLQPDGRLVLVGACPPPRFALARLNVDGSLDASFGTGGKVVTSFPNGARGMAGLLQPDGRIVAVGTIWVPSRGLAAARYNPDGTLDGTFGNGGQLTLTLPQPFDVHDAALQPDGKLVVAGSYGPLGGPFDFGLVRLLPSGAPDPSFDGDGLVTTDFGGTETGYSVVVLGDGRLILAGSRAAAGPADAALARYLANGTLDTTFGTGGLATADAGGEEFADQVIELPNDNLLLAGWTNSAGTSDFLLARFLPGGALDTTFGAAGFIRTDFGTSWDESHAVALAGPDRILAAGFRYVSAPAPGNGDFALARYIATTPVELRSFSVE